MTSILIARENIFEQDYYKLLDVCFSYADIFSLTETQLHTKDAQLSQKAFLDLLRPNFINTIQTKHWFAQYVPDGYFKIIHLFTANSTAKEILKQYYNNLYMNELSGGVYISPITLPENLCFFNANKLFLGTLSHAEYCAVYPCSAQLSSELRDICDWNIDGYAASEHLVLVQHGKYFDLSPQFSNIKFVQGKGPSF